jgi:hypothetical protein
MKKGFDAYDIHELVITGHSMGGAISYLLMLDLLSENVALPPGLHLKLAVFGSPRPGNEKFASYWQELLKGYRAKNGEDSIKEYSVKAYNDGESRPSTEYMSIYTVNAGVPSLPPLSVGYRHCTRHPLYFVHGRLYHVPESEHEYALFNVTPSPSGDVEPFIEHPRGGECNDLAKPLEF